MKMHAKEIIKNKADKMVDLIIDEIGTEGEKNLSASFVDNKTNVKYIVKMKIESGNPDAMSNTIEDEDINRKITELSERVVALEIKPDNDTIYDDTDILQRLEALETKVDNDTIYDDSGIRARLTLLENALQNE